MFIGKTLGRIIITCSLLFNCTPSSELKWNEEENYRWAELSTGYFGKTGFKKLSPFRTNIDFVNQITEKEIGENRHYLNGSGVAAGDVDGDGLVDLYFTGLGNSNRLYKNIGGMQFKDVTDSAGVAHDGYYATGAVFADVDGDGDSDLLVTSMHKDNVLYINDGTGSFERAKNSGLGPAKGSMTMTLADIDGDGDLDLYVANYKEKTVKDLYTTRELAWENILNEPLNKPTDTYTLVPPFDQHYRTFKTENNEFAGAAEVGEEDELYINRGGTFEKVADTKKVFLDEQGEPYGLQPGWGLAAKFQDLNSDGLPDLYVCNDFFTKDKVWINQGEGIFKAIGWTAIRNLSFACMGVDFSDINRDGQLDIFTAEMLSPKHQGRLRQVGSDDPLPIGAGQIRVRPTYNRNSLYLKREDHTYAEISYLSGVEATGWSWDATFMDIDLDGYEDLLVNTGYLYHILDIDAQVKMMRQGRNMDEHFTEFMRQAPPLDLPNRIFMNNGDLTFQEKGAELGFEESDVSHGMVVADLNNDGALDVVLNRMNQPAAVYQNRTNAPRIAVRLRGRSPNTQGVGAKVTLVGGPVPQQKEISAGGDYLSGSDLLVVFATNPDNSDHTIAINWPDGHRSTIDGVQANRIYEITEPQESVVKTMAGTRTTVPVNIPIFEDVSERLTHRHHEEPFKDFDLQSQLPGRLSQLGPGISWIDIDRDEDDDLLIASGKGGIMGVFENTGDGSFISSKLPALIETASSDQTSIVGWETEQEVNLLVGSANYEQANPRVPSAYLHRLKNTNASKTDSIPGIYSTTGALAVSDYNNDGKPDLFIGGRFVPIHYPKNATSRLFTYEEGTFIPDQKNSRKLNELGLVTGAVFTDYDQDGDQDLLLSREWGSIVLMENENGILNNVSDQAGLSGYKGWWNGITTGDFNNDGYPDIVATNRGLNNPYKLSAGNQPHRMYYDDFNGNGWMEIIEAYTNNNSSYVPRRRLYKYESIPAIANQMRSYEQFAKTTLKDIFGNRLSRIPYKEINTLEHMLFLNTGTEFEAHPLPIEAQFTAAFHAGVADVDNDGNEDLFLSQNFFGVPRQDPRMDAGRGLLLRGDGQGNFSPVSGSASGIKIYGEQRGAAFADFNMDGRVDLAVSQNTAETKLYLNRTKKLGYRIMLQGPSDNKNGIGASLRLVCKDGTKGPRREIQAGSGYWSQSSTTQVMGSSESDVNKIEVIWPDGTRQTADVADGQKTYVVNYHDIQ